MAEKTAEGKRIRSVCERLDHGGLDVGCMLSFNFNKRRVRCLSRAQVQGKVLFEWRVWQQVLSPAQASAAEWRCTHAGST